MIEIKNVQELLAKAREIEVGAASRYLEYAETAVPENAEIAALFQRLAEEERQHEKCVLELAADASIDLKDGVDAVNSSTDKPGNTEHAGDTLYEILAAAVNREERAFEIYSQIAACNVDEGVRHYAEILAKEELGHAALLRAMRRRVYPEHLEKTEHRKLPGPDQVTTIEEFLINAYKLETELASQLQNLQASGKDMSVCMKQSDENVQQIRTDMGANPAVDDQGQAPIQNESMSLHILLHEFDVAYEYYDRFISQAGDEKIMNYALYLASQALIQINTIQSLLNKEAT